MTLSGVEFETVLISDVHLFVCIGASVDDSQNDGGSISFPNKCLNGKIKIH